MRLRVIACPAWSRGVCSDPDAVAKYGTMPSAGVCSIACGRGTLTGEVIEVAGPKAAAFDGSALWAAIHTHKLAEATPAFIAAIAPKLSCGACRNDWLAMLARTPPDLSSADAWFAWTVARHSEVSARIGKPAMSLDEAKERWNP